jgi:thymidylate synthase (FAD)
MKVKYVNHMGTDLSVVNAARVSFGKRSVEEGYDQIDVDGYQIIIPHISSKDRKLIRYLAMHKHWTPFAHAYITFHIKAPIFVARQLGKHQVGLVWNEISRRYVDYLPELYTPDEWRLAADDKKQGSSDETIEYSVQPRPFNRAVAEDALQCYQNMIETGIAPEQARMVLPQSAYTEWYWTGSLAAFHRVCTQRTASDAQKETCEIGNQIAERCAKLFPVSWINLVEDGEYL